MLLQISFLRVTLSAVLANVSLQVLALLVLGNVFQERCLIHKTLIAGVALVWLVGLMAPRVALEVGELTEGLVAAWVTAFVGLVTSVGANVLLEMRELSKLTLTDITAVWFDAEMDASVLGEVGTVGECLGALRAFVRLRFSHMNLGMQLQVSLAAKNLEQKRILSISYNACENITVKLFNRMIKFRIL